MSVFDVVLVLIYVVAALASAYRLGRRDGIRLAMESANYETINAPAGASLTFTSQIAGGTNVVPPMIERKP